jgi:hypothetical protein
VTIQIRLYLALVGRYTMDDFMAEIAQGAIDGVIDTVVEGIRSGDIKVHEPKQQWGLSMSLSDAKSPAKSKLNAMKKYSRITEIFRKAKLLRVDPSALIDEAGFTEEDLADYRKSQEYHLRMKERKRDEKLRAQQKEDADRQRVDRELARLQDNNQRAQLRQMEMKQFLTDHRANAKSEFFRERKERKRREKQKTKEAKAFIRKHKSREPAHVKLEKEYHEKVVLPELDRQQEYLDQLKAERATKLDHEELREHERKFKHTMAMFQKTKKREAQLLLKERQRETRHFDINKGALHNVLRQDILVKEDHKIKLEIARQAREERLNYADRVKRRFKPKQDPNKHLQVERQIQQLEDKKKPKGLNSKRIQQNKKEFNSYIRPTKDQLRVRFPNSRSRFSMQPQPPPRNMEPKVEYPDYLREMRQNREKLLDWDPDQDGDVVLGDSVSTPMQQTALPSSQTTPSSSVHSSSSTPSSAPSKKVLHRDTNQQARAMVRRASQLHGKKGGSKMSIENQQKINKLAITSIETKKRGEVLERRMKNLRQQEESGEKQVSKDDIVLGKQINENYYELIKARLALMEEFTAPP